MALTKTKLCNLALSKIGNERVQLSDFDTDTGKIKDQCDLHYDPTLNELVRMHKWNCVKGRTKLATTATPTDPESVTVFGAGDSSWNTDLIYVDELNSRPRYSETGGTSATKILYFTGVEWHMEDEFGNADYKESSESTTVPQTGWTTDLGTAPAPKVNLNNDYNWEYSAPLPTNCIRPLALTNTSNSERFLKPVIDWRVENGYVLTNYSDIYLLYIKAPTPSEMDSLFAQAFYTLLASKLAVPISGDRQLNQDLLIEFNSVVMPEARRVNAFEGKESPVVDSDWLEATYTSPSNLGSSWPPFAQTSYGTFPWS
jgi:hypothetical protein